MIRFRWNMQETDSEITEEAVFLREQREAIRQYHCFMCHIKFMQENRDLPDFPQRSAMKIPVRH